MTAINSDHFHWFPHPAAIALGCYGAHSIIRIGPVSLSIIHCLGFDGGYTWFGKGPDTFEVSISTQNQPMTFASFVDVLGYCNEILGNQALQRPDLSDEIITPTS